MEAVEVCSDRFTYPAPDQFHPATFTEGCFGIFHETNAEPIHVHLIFSDLRWLKVYLQERRWHPTQSFRELEDGRLEMTFQLTSMQEVWPWIRYFGTDVEVVSPEGPVPLGFSR